MAVEQIRPVGPAAPPQAPARPRTVNGADFAAELEKATAELAEAERPVTAANLFDVDPQIYIDQAMASMQRARGHIRLAREYAQGQSGASSLDLKG